MPDYLPADFEDDSRLILSQEKLYHAGVPLSQPAIKDDREDELEAYRKAFGYE